MNRRWLALALCLTAIGCVSRAPLPPTNPRLLALPAGRWVKIHQQAADDPVAFRRQSHGGSAYDSRRSQLVLFGSDSHGRDWTNSPLIFDLTTLQWHRSYPDDDVATYRVNTEGLPVAGAVGDHPWAMHTFGAVAYDPAADVIVVASYPHHMVPGRFTNVLAELWPRVRRHPTWLFAPATGTWTPLGGEAVHFAPYSVAYDSRRGVVLGYRDDGVYELSLNSREWRKVSSPGLLNWGSNTAYDARHKALVVFGSHERGNEVVVYWPSSGRHRVMPTPGPRPPGSCYVPLEYYPDLGRCVALTDGAADSGDKGAETWLYDLGRDRWRRIASADLPYAVGMNYNLEYDPNHRLMLLVASPPGEAPAVWALRLELEAQPRRRAGARWPPSPR